MSSPSQSIDKVVLLQQLIEYLVLMSQVQRSRRELNTAVKFEHIAHQRLTGLQPTFGDEAGPSSPAPPVGSTLLLARPTAPVRGKSKSKSLYMAGLDDL